MRTPHSTLFRFAPETIAEANKLTPGTVAERDHKNGMTAGEPLIIAMDCLLKYAEAHAVRFESPLAEDYVLGPAWLRSISALRELLNGNGSVANMKGLGTDSKDNGCVESVFWAAMRTAGYKESDME